MKFASAGPGKVKLLHDDAVNDGPGIVCLMSNYEPMVYDILAEFVDSGAATAEIGSFQGGSAVAFVGGMRRRGKAVLHHCHDLFGEFSVQGQVHDIEPLFDANVEAFGVADSIVKCKGNSVDTHTTHAPSSLHYILIDGDHSYEGALRDLINFYPKLRRDGWLLLQDCVGEVFHALEEWDARTRAGLHMAMINPPTGHFIVVMNRDQGKLGEFWERLSAETTRVNLEDSHIVSLSY